MKKQETVTISRDTYLDVLGFPEVRNSLRDREEIDHLYATLVEFLETKGAVEKAPMIDKEGTRELDLKIPGIPVHVHLTAFLRNEVANFMAISLILAGVWTGNYAQVGTALVVSFMNKVTRLHKELGEVCVVESLAEVSPKTKEKICLNLYGKGCRYPNAGCHFFKSEKGTCGFRLSAVGQTLEALEKKGVVNKTNNVDPIIWEVTL